MAVLKSSLYSPDSHKSQNAVYCSMGGGGIWSRANLQLNGQQTKQKQISNNLTQSKLSQFTELIY